ncbi:MAG: hypothetical protein ACI8SJ_001061, partial [Shewanella sp.]
HNSGVTDMPPVPTSRIIRSSSFLGATLSNIGLERE